MLNLLKYEFKKRKSTLIVGLIALAVIEGLGIYALYKERPAITAALMILMAVAAIIIAFLDTAVQYFNDFKKAQGTLLFLTPNNGKKIVGSKMIFGALELITGIVISVLFMWLTNTIALNNGYVGAGPVIQEARNELLLGFGQANTWWIVVSFVVLVFLQYMASQSVAVSTITVGRTIMSRNNYNWLWAVLMFIVISTIIQTLNGTVLLLVGLGDGLFSNTFELNNQVDATLNIGKFFIAGGVQYMFWIVVSFFLSSFLLNKKVDI